MTCIVGFIGDDKTVYMGADSQATAGYAKTIRKDRKVFKVDGRFVVGVTGSPRVAQLLRYNLQPPQYSPGVDEMEFMVKEFVPALRKCLKEGGVMEVNDEVERGGLFLIGFHGRLFKIEPDQQVAELLVPFNATGSGEDIALGVMFALGKEQSAQFSPRKVIHRALEAATEFNPFCAPPYHIEELPFEPKSD